ncbi:MAG: hypothetical protein KKH28_00805 [Elusimicrobia bacterium]|nr:hypothetical protein [Elusimicrobiota bacterium]
MKEITKHHEFLKQFKEKSDLMDYIYTHTPEKEKRPYGVPGFCCGWCARPITDGVTVGDTCYHLCTRCFELGMAWDKENDDKVLKIL